MPIKVIVEGDRTKDVCVLSYSSYSTYKQCPHRYYLEKVEKVPLVQEDITYTVPGRIVHDAAEHYFKTGSMEQFDVKSLEDRLSDMGHWSTVNYDKAYGSYDKALSLLTKSAQNLQTFLLTREKDKRFMSEQWFGVWNAPLYLSDNLAIQGAADLIEVNPNGTALLYDFKTSWNTNNLSRDQLLLYVIAAKKKWDINVTMTSFFLLPTNKQNFFTFTEEDKTELLARFQRAADDILTNREKLPATKNDKCKFCPFYDTCDANRIEHSVASLSEGPVSFSFGAEL